MERVRGEGKRDLLLIVLLNFKSRRYLFRIIKESVEEMGVACCKDRPAESIAPGLTLSNAL